MDVLAEILRDELMQALLTVFGSIIVATGLHVIVHRYVRRLAAKTKNALDDELLDVVSKPLFTIVVLLGVYLATKTLSLGPALDRWVDRALFVAITLIVTVVATRVLSTLIAHWLRVRKDYEKTPALISKIVSVAVYAIAAVTALGYFGIEVTPLIATLGIGGLAVGLALQNTLSNFFAGLHLISDSPIKAGDFIEIEDGKSGFVEDVGWRSVRIRTLANQIVIVPNAKLAESTILNHSLPMQEMSVVIQCGVDYGADLERVERVTVEVATRIQQTVEGAVPDHEPVIRYHTFGDSNINFSIILRVKTFVDKYRVTHEFFKALKRAYDEAGIEISWPVRKVYTAKLP